MIVATHMGMYMPALRPDWEKLIENGEPELQVRSRRKLDLENLRTFMLDHGLTLGETIQLKNTDYQFRAYCTRGEWGLTLLELAHNIDYTKFKDTPVKYHGDTDLTNCYTKMWSAIFTAFPKGSIYSQPSRWSVNKGKGKNKGKTNVRDNLNDWYDDGWAAPIDRVTETVTYTKISEMTDRQRMLWEQSEEDRRAYIDFEMEESKHQLDDMSSGSMKVLGAGPREGLNGTLDHSLCNHPRTKSARRRCRKVYYDLMN